MIRRNNRPGRAALIRLVLAALCLWCLAPGFAMPAAAEAGQQLLEIALSAKPAEMVEPGDVMLSFSIENTSGTDARNVYLSSSDGLLYEPLGQLDAGEKQSFNRQHSVSAQELDDGEITYTISHDDPLNPEGKVNYTVSALIRRSSAMPAVEFTRQFSSRSVAPGSTLVVTYRVRNTGNVALISLRVQDSLGDFTGRVEQLAPGESRTLISRAIVNEDAVSSAVLDYSAAGMEDTLLTQTLADVPVTLAESALEGELTAGYSPFARDGADVLLILSNTGDADISNICITDEIYGGIIADGIVVPAGGEPVSVSHSYPLRGDGGFRWRIRGVSETGEKIEFLSNHCALLPIDSGEHMDLTLEAAAHTPRIRRSGSVRVTVRISNPGGSDVRDVVLTEALQGELRRFAIVPAEDSVEREFSFHVEDDADFRFSLEYTDAEGARRSVNCLPLTVEIAPDGVLPEGAEPAFFEFTGSSIKIGGSTTFAVLLIAGAAVLLALVIMLLIASRRARIRKQMRIAAEKQRRKSSAGKSGRSASGRANKTKSKGRN